MAGSASRRWRQDIRTRYRVPSGEAAGAASGYASGGPVGAVVGGALGAAGGALAGTTNMLGAPGCAAGYYYYNGYCYSR
jgi:hypothetical protein